MSHGKPRYRHVKIEMTYRIRKVAIVTFFSQCKSFFICVFDLLAWSIHASNVNWSESSPSPRSRLRYIGLMVLVILVHPDDPVGSNLFYPSAVLSSSYLQACFNNPDLPLPNSHLFMDQELSSFAQPLHLCGSDISLSLHPSVDHFVRSVMEICRSCI
jgi:hypothetical protein